MHHLIEDLRFGLRLLARNPGFAITAILLLGLGIGTNTVVFGLLDAALLRPLAVPAPGELLLLRWTSGPNLLAGSIDGYVDAGGAGGVASSTSFSYPAYEALRDAAGPLAEAVAFAEIDTLSLRHAGSTGMAGAELVSGNFFTGLGVPTALGRPIGPDDDREGGRAAVAVLSHRLWMDRFRGEGSALGAVVHLNGAPFTIIGVAPAGFFGTLQVGDEPDLYVPLAAKSLLSTQPFDRGDGSAWWVQILSRLRSGATTEQLEARLVPAFRGAAMLGAGADAARADQPRLRLEDGSRGLPEARRDFRLPLALVSGMAAIVLVVACANLAGLLLGQAAARRREESRCALHSAPAGGAWPCRC